MSKTTTHLRLQSSTEALVKPSTNLDQAFQEGCTFQYDMPYDEVQHVSFSVHKLCELNLTSGKIVACDPLMKPDSRQYFLLSVEPRSYPVFASVASFAPRGDKSFACVMLRIRENATVRWENAVINEQQRRSVTDLYGYGVDSGTGCFMDVDAAQALESLYTKSYAIVEEFDARLGNELLNNSVYDDFGHTAWADLYVNDTIKANIVAFSTGGDGGFPSFWGYDASDKITSLVTDFGLFHEG